MAKKSQKAMSNLGLSIMQLLSCATHVSVLVHEVCVASIIVSSAVRFPINCARSCNGS